MSPLGVVDALEPDLARRRLRLAAAAGSWLVTRMPKRSERLPRTVMQCDGPVTLVTEPIRPHAARTLLELDTLLAFGVVPASVGSGGGRGPQPWRVIAQEADIAVVDAGDAAMVDRLRDAAVDLVVVSETLTRVAPREIAAYRGLGVPVVRIPDGDVPAQLRLVGDVLGLAERAENLASEVEGRLLRFAPPRLPSSVAAFTVSDRGVVHVFTEGSPPDQLLRTVGLPGLAGPPGGRGGAHTVPVARGHLDRLDAEILIGLEPVAGVLSGIERDPRFAVLPAVREDRYRRFDPVSSYAVAVPSALTLPVALDAFFAALTD